MKPAVCPLSLVLCRGRAYGKPGKPGKPGNLEPEPEPEPEPERQ